MKQDLLYGEGKDPLTNESFVKTRNNQKFATHQNQIRFNNLKAQEKRTAKSTVNRFLDSNRTILIRLLGKDKEILRSKDFLLGAGFRFEYYTHYFRQGSYYAYCNYEYCVVQLENNQYKIFKNA